jgi:hypothetical protein
VMYPDPPPPTKFEISVCAPAKRVRTGLSLPFSVLLLSGVSGQFNADLISFHYICDRFERNRQMWRGGGLQAPSGCVKHPKQTLMVQLRIL